MNVSPEELLEACIQQLKREKRLPPDYKLSYGACEYIIEVAAADLFKLKLPIDEVARSIISFVIGYRFYEVESKGKNPIGFKTDNK